MILSESIGGKMELLKQRGMFLERILGATHQYYRLKRYASVYKVPVAQPALSPSNVKRAHYFCDYVGCYRGYYLEFEAKETLRPEFHWRQLRKSQQYKLHQIQLHQGLSFVVIYFGHYDQFWLFFYEDLFNFVNLNSQVISYQNCQKLGTQIRFNNSILDYLPILRKKIASRGDTIFSQFND